MKVLIFGARGQVGQALRDTVPPLEAQFVDRVTADLTQRPAIEQLLESARPQIVINAAAFTAVDRAEADAATAFAVNERAPAVIAHKCRSLGARLVHLSTDYVFDGALRRPYRADDVARPLNVYGRSKLAGEQRLRMTHGLDYLILRTSWVYSGYGRNFFRAMLDAALANDRLRVVADQVGSPTSARTLAAAIWSAAVRPDIRGTAHFTDGGIVSRHEFVAAILDAASRFGLPVRASTVEAVSSESFAAAHTGVAPRPHYSALDAEALRARLELPRPDWKTPLDAAIRHFGEQRG